MALLWARGEFFTTIDGDDKFHPDKLKIQVEEIGDQDACLCHYIRRHPRYPGGKRIHLGHNTLLFRRSLVEEIGYYDTVRFDADSEYVRRIGMPRVELSEVLLDYPVREGSLSEAAESGVAAGSAGAKIRAQYEENYFAWHEQSERPYLSFPAIRRAFEAGGPHHAVTRDPITVSLATFPEREASLRQTINSLLPWADRINVFLNEYKEPPAWLNHAKITTKVGERDLGDRGKFWWAETVQGYHFVCDDDILYSEAYAQLLLSKIEYYQRDAIVGVHGSRLTYPLNDYYSPPGRLHITFRDDKPEDMALDFLGTGALAYHTDKVRLSLDLFTENNMADIFLGLHAKRKGIPLICCGSPAGLIVDVPLPQQNSIYGHCLQNKRSKWGRRERVNQLLASHWPAAHARE